MPSRRLCDVLRQRTLPRTRSRLSWCRLLSTVCHEKCREAAKLLLTYPQSLPRNVSTRTLALRASSKPSSTSRRTFQRRAATAKSRWRLRPSLRMMTPSWLRLWRSASVRTRRSAVTRMRAQATRAAWPRRIKRCWEKSLVRATMSRWGAMAVKKRTCGVDGVDKDTWGRISTCAGRVEMYV